jgi:hypothetical protein
MATLDASERHINPTLVNFPARQTAEFSARTMTTLKVLKINTQLNLFNMTLPFKHCRIRLKGQTTVYAFSLMKIVTGPRNMLLKLSAMLTVSG